MRPPRPQRAIQRLLHGADLKHRQVRIEATQQVARRGGERARIYRRPEHHAHSAAVLLAVWQVDGGSHLLVEAVMLLIAHHADYMQPLVLRPTLTDALPHRSSARPISAG